MQQPLPKKMQIFNQRLTSYIGKQTEQNNQPTLQTKNQTKTIKKNQRQDHSSVFSYLTPRRCQLITYICVPVRSITEGDECYSFSPGPPDETD